MIGQKILHYKILEKLGEGGMGEVYLAEDTALDRKVALKFLPPRYTSNADLNKRFRREAKAAAALNHPNIITVYEIGEHEGRAYIAMEYVEGESLREKVSSGRLAISNAVDIAIQICEGLNAAHQAGIIHRDIKPENIIFDKAGRVRILDFGLAGMSGVSKLTKEGTTLGTISYMSPEQFKRQPVDRRADIWAVGVVLYEMLAGKQPFQGEHEHAVMYSVCNEEPTPLKDLRPEIPVELQMIVERALDKKIDSRLASITALSEHLSHFQKVLQPAGSGETRAKPLMSRIKTPQVAVPVILLIAVILFFGIRFYSKNAKVRWARYEAPAQVEALLREFKFTEAFLLAQKAQEYLPDGPQVKKMLETTSLPCSVYSEPPGAEIYYKDYSAVDADWHFHGRTPLDSTRLPASYLRFRVTKPGYDTLEHAVNMWVVNRLQFTLANSETAPPGMVPVPPGSFQLGSDMPVDLPAFWLDKYETTNRQYQAFVDAGGYRNPAYWQYPFVKDGDTLSFDQAMDLFHDATGQPGPATWSVGTFPEGADNYPVGGVSWYEAAAYAAFAGKHLPTVYHWRRAAGFSVFQDILPLSNFDNQGPAAAGAYHGLSGYGSYDMAGNVKEWCLNETAGKRYILGGSWNEPEYMYGDREARSPLERDATFGFRCVQYRDPLAEELTEPIDALYHDFSREKPVGDDIFEVYKGLYEYDHVALDAKIDSVEESSIHWRKETVTFNAGYGDERIIAHLFLPKEASPPYQVVIYFPGSVAHDLTSSKHLVDLPVVDFIPRSGRALMYPVYKGTYERGGGPWPGGPRTWRDWRIMEGKDVRRCIDYLETRGDIDAGKIGFFGLSWGACEGPIFMAIESRFKAAVFFGAGLNIDIIHRPPETNPLNFAPRVKVPVLMINGRSDFFYPLETSSGVLFRLLGTPEEDKRHALPEGGHIVPQNDVIRETLDWLNHYLGSVKR